MTKVIYLLDLTPKNVIINAVGWDKLSDHSLSSPSGLADALKLLQQLEINMKVQFCFNQDSQAVYHVEGDVNDMHKAYPRQVRKTLRLPKFKAAPTPHSAYDADTRFSDEVHIDKELLLNTVDPDFDFDEFKDIDDEYADLTIMHMGKDTRRWLKGYNIL